MSEQNPDNPVATADEVDSPEPEAPQVEPAVREMTTADPSFMDRVKALINEGADQQLTIRSRNGSPLLNISLALGLAIAGGITVLFPFLAVILTIVALVTKMSIDVTATQA